MDGLGLSLLALLLVIAGGAALVARWDPQADLPARVCQGAALGLTLWGLAGYLLALAIGLRPATAAAGALVVALPLLLRRPRRRTRRLRWRHALGAAAVVVVAYAVFDRVFIELPRGAIATGSDHNLGDLPFHLAIVTSFAHGDNVPPEHPELAGVRLTYPFLADFVAAELVTLGASLRAALLLENVLLAVALFGVLYRLGLTWSRDARGAWLAPLLACFSGGLGFLWFPGVPAGLRLARDYTITWDGTLRFGNLVVALLMTQRTLLLGLPMAVAAWTLWWQALGAADAGQARRRMLGAGVMIGLLPLAHSHCFAGSLLLAAVLALATRRAALWRPFFAAVLVLAVPQLALLAGDSRMHAREFLGVQLGWDRGTRDPVSFWLLNAGVFLALNLWALWRGGPPRLTLMSRAFFLLFLIPNLLRLSPWIWDNIKFLVQWHVASTPIVARVLARATRRGGWAGPLGWLGVIAATLSGALDVARVASRRIEQPLFDTDGVALARRIAESVPPAALILHAPTYNSPVYLSGRRSLLGYPGHIPSQGLDAGDREETIRRVYLGALAPSEVRAPRPLDFILVGPQERALGVLDERLLASPAVLAVGPYTLLRAAGAVEKPLATR